MRTGIYLRISQDKTGEQAGVTRQHEDCLTLAQQLGWQVVEIYQDNDTSATSSKPREHYRRMLADIEANRLDAVIAWHTDRLYRRMLDLEELVEIFERNKIMVRTCRAGEIDLSTPTGKMLARILAATAQGEVEVKADRWLRTYRQRREAGRWMGSGPRTFGYNRDGTQHPDEAPLVRTVATSILQGVTVAEICRELNDHGATTTRGNAWTPTSLRYLLRNPRLAGLVTVRGEVSCHAAEWEPILDRETWATARAVIEARATGPRLQSISLLADVAVCGYPTSSGERCGRRLVRTFTSAPVYQCRTGVTSNRHVTISARALEQMTEAVAKARLADPRIRTTVQRLLSPATPASLLREISDLEDQLDDLRQSLSVTKRDATRADIVRAMDGVRDQIDDRTARIDPLASEPIPVTGAEWPADIPRRARLIRLTVERVWVLPATTRGRFDPARVRIDLK